MVGRNDPCLCGSGKKYKKCCAGKDEDFLEQQVIQELNQILFGVFKDVSKQINFAEFDAYAQGWKNEIGQLWDMKSVEEAISAYYIFIERPNLWTDYLSGITERTLRTKVRAVVENWEKPIVLVGMVKNEENETLEIEELFGKKTYTLKKNDSMVGSNNGIVYGMVLPDNSNYKNGIRVISSLMIIKDATNELKTKLRSYVELNNAEQRPDFFEENMLEIYKTLLGKTDASLDGTQAEKPLEPVEIIEPSSADVELNRDDLTPVQLETIELLNRTIVERGVESKTDNLLKDICIAYFLKDQPNFRKANVVAAGVYRAALDFELVNDEEMTNGAVAKLFDISPGSMTKHADAVRTLIPEMVNS